MQGRMGIRIDTPTKEKAQKRAKELDISLSDYIRRLILEDIKKEE